MVGTIACMYGGVSPRDLGELRVMLYTVHTILHHTPSLSHTHSPDSSSSVWRGPSVSRLTERRFSILSISDKWDCFHIYKHFITISGEHVDAQPTRRFRWWLVNFANEICIFPRPKESDKYSNLSWPPWCLGDSTMRRIKPVSHHLIFFPALPRCGKQFPYMRRKNSFHRLLDWHIEQTCFTRACLPNTIIIACIALVTVQMVGKFNVSL